MTKANIASGIQLGVRHSDGDYAADLLIATAEVGGVILVVGGKPNYDMIRSVMGGDDAKAMSLHQRLMASVALPSSSFHWH